MAAEDYDGQAINIDEWVGSIERILESVPRYMCTPGHPGRISRIPENLREVEVKAYEPCFLSIGPYHHGKSKLQKMEKRKRDTLKFLLELKPELTLNDYLEEIRSIEPSARSFYSDIQMESEEFVRMLLLDSLCIVTAFCGWPKCMERINHADVNRTLSIEDREETSERVSMISESVQTGDGTATMPLMARVDETLNGESNGENKPERPRWFWFMFVHDVFLLENQLPFFVLEKVHDLVFGVPETTLIVQLKYEFSNMLWEYVRRNMVNSPTVKVHHLLHLGHMFFRPTLQHEPSSCQLDESNHMFRLGNAAQLYETGVRFEARVGSTEYSLLDITFNNSGKMTMPCLCVDDNTESLLRNLIALEQMKYPSMGLNVSAYAVLLLHLITIPDDVKLLRRKGIIHHHLSSDKEIVYFINRLSVGLAFDYVEDNYSLKPVFRELQSYSQRRTPRWRAWLKHRHFKNPWTMISLLAGFFLLFLTFIQTYYTVYCYYNPCLHSRS